ncbi:MAG: response regulator [Rhodoferax sp.]|nr:response regulator [Rhodoferax sp.]MCF8209774.1 response regulator [Rhodoferax sp.]
MKQATVLAVDDTLESLQLLTDILGSEGYRVLPADSGELALESVVHTRPQLILLDLRMPGMDGFEVLRRLKELPGSRDIPVIILSAVTDAEQRVEGLRLGAMDFVSKPFQRDELLARVKTHVELDLARRRLEQQASDLQDTNARLEIEIAERRLAQGDMQRLTIYLQQANESLTRAKAAAEQAHQQLLQSDKMASMGHLAAGVAHELNNPISFVASNLGVLGQYLDDIFAITAAYQNAEDCMTQPCAALDAVFQLKEDKDFDFIQTDARQLVQESQEGLERVTTIVRNIKNFSRTGDTTWTWVDLRAGLESTLNIVWNELKYKCTVTKDYGEAAPVWGAASQLNQVFLNLLVNAAQAIPDRGSIHIATGQRGAEVFVAISDTGQGMDAETLARIFEPFYTTKPVGQGTGLGLSLSHEIIQAHHGRIMVDSVPAQGSTFTLWLPTHPPASETAPA